MLIRALSLLLLLWTVFARGESIEDALLPAEEAFRLEASVRDADTLALRWDIAKGYYLYRKKFEFFIDTEGYQLGEPVVPAGQIKHDEYFGDVEIYRDAAEILLPIRRTTAAPVDFVLRARFQGCADLGVCYPPVTRTVKLSLAAVSTPAATAPDAQSDAAPSLFANLQALVKQPAADADQLLSPDQAFRLEAAAVGAGQVRISLLIEPGHYLYKDKLKFAVVRPQDARAGAPQLPAGSFQEDEFFGRQEIYDSHTDILLPIAGLAEAGEVALSVQMQGCSKIGICYPPIQRELVVDMTAAGLTSTRPEAATPVVQEQDRIARLLEEGGLWWAIAAFFGFGLLLAFTPCVLPMVPILSGLIVGHGRQVSAREALWLSVAFVLAMAATYAVLGVVAGATGANLQAWVQKPLVLYVFAGVFVMLALSMFGLYDLQMPSALQTRLSRASSDQKTGSLIGAGLMGFFSAIIVGPCVTPPLVGALLYMSHSGGAVEGGLALFAMGLGMGTPLLVLGASAGHLLPKAGAWMDAVKELFGILLLGVALWLLERVIPLPVLMGLGGVLMIVSGIYMGALDTVATQNTGWRRLWKGLGLAAMIYGALLLVGAAGGGQGLLQPLKGVLAISGGPPQAQAAGLPFRSIKGMSGLKTALTQAAGEGRPVMLDFYADWCVACKEMETYTFTQAEVQSALKDAILLQSDVTAYDADDQALLRHFNIYGPPAIVFFNSRGEELRERRVFGFVKASEFAEHVRRSLADEALTAVPP